MVVELWLTDPLLELAIGSTVVLDVREVNHISLEVQAKCPHTIESGAGRFQYEINLLYCKSKFIYNFWIEFQETSMERWYHSSVCIGSGQHSLHSQLRW